MHAVECRNARILFRGQSCEDQESAAIRWPACSCADSQVVLPFDQDAVLQIDLQLLERFGGPSRPAGNRQAQSPCTKPTGRSLPIAFWPFVSLASCPLSLSLPMHLLFSISPLPPAGRTVTCNGLLNDFPAIELHVPAAEQYTQTGSSPSASTTPVATLVSLSLSCMHVYALLFLSLSCTLCSKCKAAKHRAQHLYMHALFDSILSAYLSVSVQARLSCGRCANPCCPVSPSFLVLLTVVLVLLHCTEPS